MIEFHDRPNSSRAFEAYNLALRISEKGDERADSRSAVGADRNQQELNRTWEVYQIWKGRSMCALFAATRFSPQEGFISAIIFPCHPGRRRLSRSEALSRR